MNNRWLGEAAGLASGCLLSIAALRCEAQNLVPNHSFEIPDSCPGTHTFITPGEGPLGWFSGGGTPDYYQSCVPPPNQASVPLSDFAYQFPQEGENFIGLVTYEVNSGGLREYAMVELTTPLVLGQTYAVSFYANAAWNGTDSLYPQHYLASSHIGALFTMQPRQWLGGDPWPLATGSAHVFHPGIIADTVNWTLVSGSFVADSAYRYLMVGNHYDNVVSDTVSLGPSIQLPKAYTLVDNVCVSDDAEGVGSYANSAVLLVPNPAVDEFVVIGLLEDAVARVFDATGREVWNGLITRGSQRMEVGTWAPGCYFLKLGSGVKVRSLKFVLME